MAVEMGERCNELVQGYRGKGGHWCYLPKGHHSWLGEKDARRMCECNCKGMPKYNEFLRDASR